VVWWWEIRLHESLSQVWGLHNVFIHHNESCAFWTCSGMEISDYSACQTIWTHRAFIVTSDLWTRKTKVHSPLECITLLYQVPLLQTLGWILLEFLLMIVNLSTPFYRQMRPVAVSKQSLKEQRDVLDFCSSLVWPLVCLSLIVTQVLLSGLEKYALIPNIILTFGMWHSQSLRSFSLQARRKAARLWKNGHRESTDTCTGVQLPLNPI